MSRRKVSIWALVEAVLFAGFGTAAAYFGQPLIHGNSEAINVIVTVFSILAGFLIAIIAIVGDPGLLRPGGWRSAELDRTRIVDRLVRYKWLFYLYLMTLTLVFVSILVPENLERVVLWTERFFLFFGVIAFLCSFLLPSALMMVQQERIDAFIEHRRSKSGINNEGESD